MRMAWRPKCKPGLVTRSSSDHNMPKEARVRFGFSRWAAKVWFGDSRCILICLTRAGGWTRPLFIPSEVEIGLLFS